MSTRPGATTASLASRTVAPAGASIPGPTSAITAPRTSTSATRSPVSSITLPPCSSTIRSSDNEASRPEDGVEHGHADGDTVGDLFGDERAGRIRDLVGDLDAAVHRAGVHDERVGLQ